jgi:hypothetical protein
MPVDGRSRFCCPVSWIPVHHLSHQRDRRHLMWKTWALALAIAVTITGAQPILAMTVVPQKTAHKVDCQSTLKAISFMRPIDKNGIYNKSQHCGFVF